MIRSTSIETFHQITEEGLLTKQRLKVYRYLYLHGPMTSGEYFFKSNNGNPVKALTQNRARFTELREMGAIAEIGVKKCTVTGRRALLWQTTDKIPKPLPKKKTNQQIIAQLKEQRGLMIRKFVLTNYREKSHDFKLEKMQHYFDLFEKELNQEAKSGH